MRIGAFTQEGGIITASGAASGNAGKNLSITIGSGNAAGNSAGGSLAIKAGGSSGTAAAGVISLQPGFAGGTGISGSVQILPFNNAAGGTTQLAFFSYGGTTSVGFKAADTIAANVVWTLPAADGSNSQVLQTNGAGVLSWVNQAVTRPSTNKTTPVAADSILLFDSASSNSPVYSTWTQTLNALNIVTASANGILVRTAAGTYTSRTMAASATAGQQGVVITNGDGVAGAPTVGLSISGLTAGTPNATTVIPAYDGTNNVKITPASIVTARIVRGTFTSATLTANVLTITHNLAVAGVLVQVYDDSNNLVQPDNITLSSNNATAVDLTSFTVSGTWSYVVFG